MGAGIALMLTAIVVVSTLYGVVTQEMLLTEMEENGHA